MLTFVVLISVFIIFNSYEKYKYINNSKAKYYAKQYYNTYLIQIIKQKYKKIKLYENKIITSTNESTRFQQLLVCKLQIKIKRLSYYFEMHVICY